MSIREQNLGITICSCTCFKETFILKKTRDVQCFDVRIRAYIFLVDICYVFSKPNACKLQQWQR